MNPIFSKVKIYTFSVTLLSLIAVLLRTLCLFWAFDADLGYYAWQSPLPNITNAVTLLILIWAASALLFIPRNTMKTVSAAPSTPSVFAGTLCGFLMLFAAVLDAYAYLSENVFFPAETRQRDMIVYLIIILTAFLTALYFLTALKPSLSSAPWRVYLGFAPILWALFTLARAYFDLYHAMNDPNKVLLELALMSIMLLFLQEMRTLLNRAMPRFALFCQMLAVLLCGTAALPALIAAQRGIATLTDFRYDFILVAAIWLYALCRLFDTMRLQNKPQAESESAI